jgi:hypothetical protein
MNIFERARQPGHDRRARTLVHALRLRKRLGTWLKGRLRECCDLEHSPPEGAAKPQRGMFSRVDAFVRDVRELETEDALAGALGDVSRDLGFRYFALTHHVDVRCAGHVITSRVVPLDRQYVDEDYRMMLEWILGHELGHILNGDGRAHFSSNRFEDEV